MSADYTNDVVCTCGCCWYCATGSENPPTNWEMDELASEPQGMDYEPSDDYRYDEEFSSKHDPDCEGECGSWSCLMKPHRPAPVYVTELPWADDSRAPLPTHAEDVALIWNAMRLRDLEREERREYWGEDDAKDLAVTGYWDVWYDEWVASDVWGSSPGMDTWVRTDKLQVSHYRLQDAIEFLIYAQSPGLTARTMRWFTRLAKLQLDAALYPAKGQRDVRFMDEERNRTEWDVIAHNECEYVNRDNGVSDKAITSRWNRPEDELAFMEWIRESGREGEWTELMAAWKRRKLERLLRSYFDVARTADLDEKEIVLKWTKRGTRWVPERKMLVPEWIEWSCEEASILVSDAKGSPLRIEQRGGSLLGGLQSCILSVQKKAQLKNKRLSLKEGREEAWPTMADIALEMGEDETAMVTSEGGE